MHSYVRPYTWVVIRLASDQLKIAEVIPNSSLSLGRFGSIPANLIIGRPFFYTFEISENEAEKNLRVVPATELHAEAITSTVDVVDTEAKATEEEDGVEFDIIGEDGEVIMRSNRLTVDDPSRQLLTMDEIEELKRAGTGSGKEIIARIMASHQAIEEKTSFALAKYTLRKTRKYLKRFTILPLDISTLVLVLTDKESHKIMDLRDESIGLIISWANTHFYGADEATLDSLESTDSKSGGRWLAVDDTGGLVVASLAERMGILYPEEVEDEFEFYKSKENSGVESNKGGNRDVDQNEIENSNSAYHTANLTSVAESGISQANIMSGNDTEFDVLGSSKPEDRTVPVRHAIPAMSARTNTLTIIHPAPQPNLSLLRYFCFDSSFTQPTPTSYPSTSRGLLWPSIAPHPLFTHLKCLSWLQLLDPNADSSYQEPEYADPEIVRTWKSSKRGAYYRKRRRWERSKLVIDETRNGGFDGLVVASSMEPATILKHTVPLLRGGAQVVVYSPHIEPLTELADLYSKERKSSFLERFPERAGDLARIEELKAGGSENDEELRQRLEQDEQDYPLDPTLLLGVTVQTARARKWQVLPGRTHPLMTSRGGSEGYVFSATRVLPVDDRKVSARGNFGKRRKVDVNGEGTQTSTNVSDIGDESE